MDVKKALSLLGAISIASIAVPSQVSAAQSNTIAQMGSAENVTGVQVTTLHKSLHSSDFNTEHWRGGHYSHGSHASHASHGSHASHASHASARW